MKKYIFILSLFLVVTIASAGFGRETINLEFPVERISNSFSDMNLEIKASEIKCSRSTCEMNLYDEVSKFSKYFKVRRYELGNHNNLLNDEKLINNFIEEINKYLSALTKEEKATLKIIALTNRLTDDRIKSVENNLSQYGEAMEVIYPEGLSPALDTNIIFVEEIYTKSRVPYPNINYCKMINDVDIYSKENHYAYRNIGERLFLDSEYRWLVLEGCEKQKLREMCVVENNKYTWCEGYKP